MAAETTKVITIRAPKQDLYNLLAAQLPALFGSKIGLTYPTGFDIKEDDDLSYIKIVFNKEPEPNP